MNYLLVLIFLLVFGVQANFIPRQDKLLQTASVPIPTEAEPFTTKIAGCGETAAPIVFVGVPTGTFNLVNPTIFLPPQAEPTNIDFVVNDDEIFDIHVIPLQGECQTLPVLRQMELPVTNPSAARDNAVRSRGVADEGPPWMDPFCSSNSCSGHRIRETAKEVINFVNYAILFGQNLQTSAYNTGNYNESKELEDPSASPENLVSSLLYTSSALWSSIKVLDHMAVFGNECDQDAIIVAVMEFSLVHQRIFSILREQAGLSSECMSVTKAEEVRLGVVKTALIEALHSLESSFFNSIVVLGGLIPSRESCAMHEISTFGMAVAEVIDALEA